MGLHATVYLTGEEAALLEEFCTANGCTKSEALKHGLRLLSDGSVHSSGEHNGHGVSIILAPKEVVIANIRQGMQEAEVLRKAREEEDRPFREIEERAKNIAKGVFK